MKSSVRYLVMAVVAFGLGAILAYLQRPQVPTVAEVSKTVEVPMETAAADHPHEHKAAPVQTEPMTVAGVQVGGPFSLTDHKGNKVTEKSWPGKHKLVFFGFTHCPDICIAALERLSVVMNQIDKDGQKLVPLFVTVDPERDTPAVVTEFLSKYNPHVVGLTGTPEEIKAMQATYKVYSAKIQPGEDPHAYMMNHSSYVYFMSPDDKLLELLASDETGEGMIKRIKLHMQ